MNATAIANGVLPASLSLPVPQPSKENHETLPKKEPNKITPKKGSVSLHTISLTANSEENSNDSNHNETNEPPVLVNKNNVLSQSAAEQIKEAFKKRDTVQHPFEKWEEDLIELMVVIRI